MKVLKKKKGRNLWANPRRPLWLREWNTSGKSRGHGPGDGHALGSWVDGNTWEMVAQPHPWGRGRRPLSLRYHSPRLPSLGPRVLSLWTREANHKESKSPQVFQEILVMKDRISGWSMRRKKGVQLRNGKAKKQNKTKQNPRSVSHMFKSKCRSEKPTQLSSNSGS